MERGAHGEPPNGRDPLAALAHHIAGRAQKLIEGFDRYFERVLSRRQEGPGSEIPDGANGQLRADPHRDEGGGQDR